MGRYQLKGKVLPVCGAVTGEEAGESQWSYDIEEHKECQRTRGSNGLYGQPSVSSVASQRSESLMRIWYPRHPS